MQHKSEKDLIREWAKNESTENIRNKYLPLIDEACESYWIDCSASNDIEDYGFNTVPELRAKLEEQLSDEVFNHITQVLTIASFKEKINFNEGMESMRMKHKNKEDGFEIPEFVYVF